MAYTAIASQASQPLDTVDRSTAAAEFRELKTHINGLSTIASGLSPDIFNNTNKIINYTGAVLATGFAAAPQAGAERLLYCTGAAQFTAGANLIIEGVSSGNTLTVAAGNILMVIALTTTQFKLVQISPVGSALLATTATNQNGGYVNGTTGVFSGTLTTVGKITRIYGAGAGADIRSTDNVALNVLTNTGFAALSAQANGTTDAVQAIYAQTDFGATAIKAVANGGGYPMILQGDLTTPARAALRLVPQDSPPSSPQIGDIFCYSVDNLFYGYTGAGWTLLS